MATTPADEYGIDITRKPTRAGRMNSGEFSATVTTPEGEAVTQTRLFTPAAASQWAATYIEDHRSGRIAALKAQQAEVMARRAAAEHAPTAVETAPPRDRNADRVASLIGAPASKATGRCHYCGLPLNRRGYCEECV